MKNTLIIFAVLIVSLFFSNAFAAEMPGQRRGDTIYKLADPEAIIKEIPTLAAAPRWKDFATPEEIKLFEGQEILWPMTPESQYDLNGFDPTMLGSKVPPSGVHPRIFFSPGDIPMLYKRLQNSVVGRQKLWATELVLNKTIYNPESDEGKQFAKLASGNLDGLQWDQAEYTTAKRPAKPRHIFKGYKYSWRYSPHDGYITKLMNGALLLSHFQGDDARGKELATAVANYWKLREEIIDDFNANAPKYFYYPRDIWRGIHQMVGGRCLPLNYDLAACWMSEDQKKIMRRIIAKVGNDRRGYGMNAPLRWMNHNWCPWDARDKALMTLAIQGEEGYDPAIIENISEHMAGLLEFYLDESGVKFEPNGKGGMNFLFQILVMLRRHGIGPDYFGHPHLRAMTKAQAHIVFPQTVKTGSVTASSGTWANAPLQSAGYFRTFYPKDPCADWLLRQLHPDQNENSLEKYKVATKSIMRITSDFLDPTHDFYNCIDWTGFKDKKGNLLDAGDRTPMALPLDFADPLRGVFVTRTDNSPEALFLNFEARNDLTNGGHNFFNAGLFQFSAMGKVWSMIGNPKGFAGNFSSVPRIDGQSYIDPGGNSRPPKVDYLGTVTDELLTMGSANVKNCWDYAWLQPFNSSAYYRNRDRKISVETDPEVVKFYKGTQHRKSRLRAHSYYHLPWAPTMRAQTRPVDFAYRSAGMIKGDHPYVVIIDDLKMDSQQRLYEWIMQMPLCVRALAHQGQSNEVVLMYETADTIREFDQKRTARSALDNPPKGTPLLLVKYLGQNNVNISVRQEMYSVSKNQTKYSKVLSMGVTSEQMRSRVLLIPFKAGQKLPEISYNPKANIAKVNFSDKQADTLQFITENNRTRLKLKRQTKDNTATATSP